MNQLQTLGEGKLVLCLTSIWKSNCSVQGGSELGATQNQSGNQNSNPLSLGILYTHRLTEHKKTKSKYLDFVQSTQLKVLNATEVPCMQGKRNICSLPLSSSKSCYLYHTLYPKCFLLTNLWPWLTSFIQIHRRSEMVWKHLLLQKTILSDKPKNTRDFIQIVSLDFHSWSLFKCFFPHVVLL